MQQKYTMDEVHTIHAKINAELLAPSTDDEYCEMLNRHELLQEGIADALDTVCASADFMHYNQAQPAVQLALAYFN